MNIWQLIQHKVPAPTQKMPTITRTLPSVDKDIGGIPGARPTETTASLQTTQERVQAIFLQKGESMPANTLKELVQVIDRLPASQKEMAMELMKVLAQRNGITNIPEQLQMMVKGLSAKGTTLQMLGKLEVDIQKMPLPTPIEGKLLEVIQKMQQPPTIHTKMEMLQFIKQAVSLLGLDFEKGLSEMIRHNQPLSEMKLEQLKPLLLNYLQHVDTPEEKGAITQLLSKLTSFQLLSREEGNLHQLFLPIPIKMNEETKEWYVHLTSKKKGETLDPEYCRIVLLLDLPEFSSVMVDVLVQQKVVSILLQHSYPGMGRLIEKSAPLLRNSLSSKGYTVSAVKEEWKEQEKRDGIPLDFLKTILTPSEKGLDVRI